MPRGSLYSGIEDAHPIGRARLLNLYAHCYPGLQLGRSYPILGSGEDADGVYLYTRVPRYVQRCDFEVKQYGHLD